uniref:Uncharacterized protein n=1 Tax=Equus asinus TaxID=9793 RepID=A0A9L0K632_EQUAS
MNPVYSPGSSGVPYANAKGIGYPAGFPMGYTAAAPAYSPNMYPGANPTPPSKQVTLLAHLTKCPVPPPKELCTLEIENKSSKLL